MLSSQCCKISAFGQNVPASKRSMPPALNVRFDIVRDKDIEKLKVLNGAIFPIKYQDHVYRQILASGPVSQLAYHNDTLVGAIGCRLEAYLPGTAKLYIASLGVLAPYRGNRIGSRLLEQCLSEARQDENIKEAYLHVQSNNEDAMRFYQRFDFEIGKTVANYYRKLDPPDAVILKRVLAQ